MHVKYVGSLLARSVSQEYIDLWSSEIDVYKAVSKCLFRDVVIHGKMTLVPEPGRFYLSFILQKVGELFL